MIDPYVIVLGAGIGSLFSFLSVSYVWLRKVRSSKRPASSSKADLKSQFERYLADVAKELERPESKLKSEITEIESHLFKKGNKPDQPLLFLLTDSSRLESDISDFILKFDEKLNETTSHFNEALRSSYQVKDTSTRDFLRIINEDTELSNKDLLRFLIASSLLSLKPGSQLDFLKQIMVIQALRRTLSNR